MIVYRTLDSVLEDLSKNLGEGTDYFQVLVDIFKNSFRTEEQKHLRNFFIIGAPFALRSLCLLTHTHTLVVNYSRCIHLY
jgi:hypothetical protein